jgi:SAM-dependent methyltransferase
MVTEQRAAMENARPLSARLERFDSFWEGPEDVERGYHSFGQFYRVNYLKHLPPNKDARILVISCGPGYFVNLLGGEGYTDVRGVDSDSKKVEHAVRRGLNCHTATAFEELRASDKPYDLIFFLRLVWERLTPGGRLICHGLNGANPIVGAETLAQNFDHFNTFTAYSLRQALQYSGFEGIEVYGLHLYVFYKNPFNYVAWVLSALLSATFRALFVLYGKSNKIFTKKIAAVAHKRR